MYLMLFVKRTSSRLQSTTLGVSPPLILGFHPSKASCCPDRFLRSGQHCSCFYLGITHTEAFLMVSNASYPDVRSMTFSRSIVLVLLIIYEYHVISVQVMF